MDNLSRRSLSVQPKETCIIKSVFLGESWFEIYTLFQKDSSSVQGQDFHLDILQDLWNVSLNDNIVLHLLTLLEQWYWMFQDAEKLEQTVGSLLNIFTSSHLWSVTIKSKCLFTCTTLLACNLNLMQANAQLQKLLSSFLELLIEEANADNGSLSKQANECLIQFEECSPTILATHQITSKMKENNTLLNSLLIRNGTTISPKQIKVVIDSLSNYTFDPYRLHLILNYLFDSMKSKSQLTITPFIFKQFIKTFVYSTEIYNFHFALLLLRSFGLELFSTSEELNLLNRLILLATHPSLIISIRLLILDFVKSFLPSLKVFHLIDVKMLQLTSFDGPDTQEKKLLVLNETEMNDEELILNLKTMETSSLHSQNRRATNSLYRLFYAFLKYRPSLQENIERLIISMIFAYPKQHVANSLQLLESMKCLVPKVCKTFTKKLITMSQIVEEAKEDDIEQFMLAIQWILKQKVKLLEDNELLQLLQFCLKTTQANPKLVKQLLNCCAAVIRTQKVTDDIKLLLNSSLSYLISSKIDVTISSWSQIYSIAINTLPNQESLQKVFCEDVNLNQGTPLIIRNHNNLPLIIERVTPNLEPVAINSPLFILLQLKLTIDPMCVEEFKKLFAIEIRFKSIKHQKIDQLINIPFLDCKHSKVINLKIKPIEVKPFSIKISTQFSDINGITYFYDLVKLEQFNIINFLTPISLDDNDFDSLWNQIGLKTNQSLFESVICLEQYSQINQFIKEHQFLKQFSCSIDHNKFVIGLSPNKLLLFRLYQINNVISLRLKTDEPKAVKYIYFLFKHNDS